MICSLLPGRLRNQPICVLPPPHAVEPCQHTGFALTERKPLLEGIEALTVCCVMFAIVIAGGAARLAYWTEPFEFQLVMFASQMPYSAWVPVA